MHIKTQAVILDYAIRVMTTYTGWT